jgi:hypothetical protein
MADGARRSSDLPLPSALEEQQRAIVDCPQLTTVATSVFTPGERMPAYGQRVGHV